MLLIELGMLGRMAGGEVTLEPRIRADASPADVLIELDGVRLAVEARAILFDDQMREGRRLCSDHRSGVSLCAGLRWRYRAVGRPKAPRH